MNEPTKTARPPVFYVSYDGIGEPLGRSQVLGYLFRLADRYDITLFSYEKDDADIDELRRELTTAGIRWVPLRYHRRPPVLSTLLDVAVGALALVRAARRVQPEIIHVRSYVPALMSMLARRWTGGRLLFDIRGFWADERVEGGIWPQTRIPYRLLFRLTKRCERWFFRSADAVVTLTEASLEPIRRLTGDRRVPTVVIPTCADLGRFAGNTSRTGEFQVTWCGSVGTWYRFDLVPALARALDAELEVITRQRDEAIAALGGAPAKVHTLPPSEVPSALLAGDVGVCLCVPAFSKVASAPTRFAEYLAAGMPVIVSPEIGDLKAIVERHHVGVVLRGEDDLNMQRAARELRELTGDPTLSDRCRKVARDLFDVEVGARRYAELYEVLRGQVPQG